MMMKNRKGISPVIATVILVAVAITVAIAVSYWMSGITSSYTKFEKVEIQTAVCGVKGTPTANVWAVTLTLKNTGTNTATILNVFVNDQLASNATAVAGVLRTDIPTGGKTISSGQTATIVISIGDAWPDASHALTSGTSINIKLHSAGGMDYIKLVELV